MRRAAVAMILAAVLAPAAWAAPAKPPAAKPAAAKPAPAPAKPAAATPAPAKPAATANTAVGTVVDSKSGKPIAGAYVYQPGSLNGVLTDGKGQYRLLLDAKYGADVLVSKETYEPLQVTASVEAMTVKLSPLTLFGTATPTTTVKAGQHAIGSLFNAHYQIVNQTMGSGGSSISGLVTNQFSAQGQFRMGDFLFRGEGTRNRVPVDVEGFPYKPTVSFDSYQARLGASYVLPIGLRQLEFAIGPEYLVNYIQADNRSGQDAKPIPFTNTFVDRFPLRQGLGANVILGYRPLEPLYLAVEGSYHPVVFSATEPGTAPLGGMQYWTAGVRADYALFTGAGIGVAYRRYSWFGDINDTADQFSIGLSFNPYMLN
jgi:hypothetical protein